jgi:hypothetical protein
LLRGALVEGALVEGHPVIVVNMPANNASASFTVDDECVYWSNDQGIFNLAKQAAGPFSQ